MESHRFHTVVPESGMIQLPERLLRQFVGRSAEIILREVAPCHPVASIQSLRGKYRDILSSTEAFSQRKVVEKALEQ